MTAPTLVPGVINFRDIGGLPAGAAVTRSGVLYRSGHLAKARSVGAEQFAALGIRQILDLRADDEVDRDRTDVGDVPIRRVPLFLGSVASFFTNDQSLDDMYRSLVDESGDRVVTAVRTILDVQPLLVHCTVGKDRTGVTVALALAAAGVDEDAVVADYARTADLLPPERNADVLTRLGAMFPNLRHLEELTTLSPAPVMRALLADLRARYGSPADYLRAQGMTDDEIAGLSDVLVEGRGATIL